ncbi:MAG: zinc-ribbon domain-containing protein [Lachnospiraceae bacterium]|nr:zinc-ribbon domain-containing protein [Lachnospiraceae bacterium]
MFCEKCGTQLQDDERFCPKCGTPVPILGDTTPQAVETPVQAAVAQAPIPNVEAQAPIPNVQAQAPIPNVQVQTPIPAAVAQPNEKKKGKSKILLPILIAAAAVAVVALVVVVNAARIGNFFHKTFSSPEKYYQYVESKNAEEMAEIMASYYGNYVDSAKNAFNTTYNTSVSVEIGEAGKDLLELSGLLGVDLSWLESASLSGGVTLNDDKMSINLAVGVNKDNLMSLITLFNVDEGEAYLQIPELTSTYIGIEIDDYSYDDFLDEWEEMKEVYVETFDSLPSEAGLEKLLAKYMKIALGAIEDVEKKDKTLKVEGVEQKCTALIITIDADTMADILEAILDEAEDDKELEKFIVVLAEAMDEDGDDLYDELIDGLEYMQKSLSRVRSSEEIVMTVYVDGKGSVVGREIEIDDVTISLLMPEKGKNFGYEFSVEERGVSFSVTGSGKKSGNKIDGDFRVRYNGMTMLNITTDDLNLKTLKRGMLNGKLEVSLGSGIGTLLASSAPGMSLLQDISFSLDAKTTENSYEYKLGIVYDDGDIGTITVSGEQKKASNIKLPNSKDVIYVEDERDLEEWAEEIDWDKVISKLEKTDLPRSVTKFLKKLGDAVEDGEIEEFLEDLLWSYYGYISPYDTPSNGFYIDFDADGY